MSTNKRDLLIHYDEENQTFVFYSVPTADTFAIRQQAFDGVRLEVDFYKSLTPDEAEMALGGLTFSTLDLGSKRKVQIRDYEAAAETARAERVKALARMFHEWRTVWVRVTDLVSRLAN